MGAIRDVMTSNLITVAPSSTVAEAATVMGERQVGSALVMEGESLAGIFTERDIVRALSQDFDAPRDQVTQWMTRDPKTVGPDVSVHEALDIMLAGGFRHLPVVEGELVVGMVSIRDLSRAATES